MERFNPLNDYLFLKLMGEEGDEEQCLAFLNAVLGSKSLKPVALVKILENKTFVADVIGDKSSILDVRWLSFFDISTPEEELKEIIKMDSAINKTQERLDFVTQDKEVLREYHLREMAQYDWNTAVYTATEKGIEKGAMQKQIEIARNSLNEGLPIETIHKITGLDIETIQTLTE
jgi:hypothetical protein